MHHMRVTLDDHLVGELHAAHFSDAAHVVATQIDEHEMLGKLLRIGEQVLLQGLVFRFVGPALARAGDGAHGDRAVFQAHQDLRRGADHVEALQVQVIHVGRWIHTAQCAVEIQRPGLERNGQALRQHHLHDVAVGDVLAGAADRVLEALLGETGDEVFFAHRCHTPVRMARGGAVQPAHQGIEAPVGLGQRFRHRRVGQHDHE